jgi:hypothetical protein
VDTLCITLGILDTSLLLHLHCDTTGVSPWMRMQAQQQADDHEMHIKQAEVTCVHKLLMLREHMKLNRAYHGDGSRGSASSSSQYDHLGGPSGNPFTIDPSLFQ